MSYVLFHPEDQREPPLFLTAEEFARAFPIESDVLERKQSVGSDAVQETVVAFSNTRGGVVLFGVADDGRVVGMPLTQRANDKIHTAVGAARNPGRYAVRSVAVEDREVTVLSVERRVEGFAQTSNGRILVRMGPRNVSLFDAELARFIQDRSFARVDATDAHVSIDAADDGLVRALAEAYGWTETEQLQEFLVQRGLALPRGQLTVAGVLLVVAAPDAHLGKALIDVLRFPDENGEVYDRRIAVRGPVSAQIEEAVDIVQDELGTEMVIVGVERYELPRLPVVVLREAIANAVAHRSYELTGSAVRVELRPHEVRVISPGGLPAPVTVENMRDAQAARNPIVIDALRRLRLAEDAGRGIGVIQDTMREEMLDPPTFSDTGHSVAVTLPTHGSVTARERAWVREVERRGQVDPADRILLVHAARGETLTNQAARRITGLDRVEATRALQRLRSAGFLRQQGVRGGATYRLEGSLDPPAGLRLSNVELRDVVLRLAADGAVTNARVRATTGLDRVAALRLLDDLVSEGQLVRVGERRGTRYRLAGAEDGELL